MNKDDVIKIKAPMNNDDLVEMGYMRRTLENHPKILKMWLGIGDSAEVRYDYELDDGSGIVVLPNKVYWALYETYYKEMKYVFGKKKFALYNEKRKFCAQRHWEEYKLGINGIFEAQRLYDEKVAKAIGANKAAQLYDLHQLQYELDLNCGVYGVYKGDKLVYIGSTMRSFDERWQEHLDAGKFDLNYEMKPLYTKYAIQEDLGMQVLADRELRLIEFMLIRQYKPEMNKEGVTTTFRLGKKDISRDPCFMEQYTALQMERMDF